MSTMVIVATSGVAFSCSTVSPSSVGNARLTACGSQMRRKTFQRLMPKARAASSWPRCTPAKAPRITSPS